MTDQKFEPDQLVLVRQQHPEEWRLLHYSHASAGMYVCGCISWAQCIPYTPETAHLLGTSQPYEPPKPPVTYEWGQKVEVFRDGCWLQGLYVGKANPYAHHVLMATQVKASVHDVKNIRPLPDDTATH